MPISLLLIGSLVFTACASVGDATDSKLEALMSGSDGLTAQIFSDGVVTDSEFEEASLVAVQCVRDAGVDIEFEYKGFGTYDITLRGGSSLETLTVAEQIEADCFEEHLVPVARVFALLNRPSVEEIEAETELMISCLRAHGHNVESREEILGLASTDAEAILECQIGQTEGGTHG